jgi:hypothetical protein
VSPAFLPFTSLFFISCGVLSEEKGNYEGKPPLAYRVR